MAKKSNPVAKENVLPREEYIQQLSKRTNEVSITHENAKTGGCCNDLAFPTCTCRDDAPCKLSGACYCLKGTQKMCSVLQAYTRNLRLYNTDPKDFWEQVACKIKHNPLPLFRFFDCGDIPDYDFLLGMVELAKQFPNIKFMSFTKQYEIVNTYLGTVQEGIPENLTIRFSAWDKNWDVPNPYNLPVAYCDFTDKTLNPEFPEKCASCPNQSNKTITCSMCQKCWNRNIKTVKFIQH